MWKLKRVTYLPKETLGVLLFNGEPIAVTLENPNLDNRRWVSCIPTGKYTCKRYFSKNFGETFIVDNVKGRSGILFHAGNTAKDTHGCILLGTNFGKLDEQNAILNSKLAISYFYKLLRGQNQFELEITD